MVKRFWLLLFLPLVTGLDTDPGDALLLSGSLKHGGHGRTYLLRLPRGYTPQKRHPLVLALHGGGGNARTFNESTSGTFYRAADRHGIIVVVPDGLGKRWQDGRQFLRDKATADGDKPVPDDASFLTALVRLIRAKHAVDPDRIAATGISNGGMMSFALAARHDDVFAAVCPVTANVPVEIRDIKVDEPVSVLLINGTRDPLVPYEGGDITLSFGLGPAAKRSRGKVLSTDQSLALWRQHCGLNGPAATRTLKDTDPSDGCRVHEVTWTAKGKRPVLTLLRIDGGGHTWPGGKQYLPARRIGPVCRDIDASDRIMRFIRDNPKVRRD